MAQLVRRHYASFKNSWGKDREWWQNTMCTWYKGFFTFLFCKNNIKFKNIAKVVGKKRPRAQSGKLRDVMCLVTLCLQFTIISSKRLIPLTLLSAKSRSCLIRFSSMKNTILIWNRNYVFSEASLSCLSEKSVYISDDTSPLDNEMLLSRATKWNMWLNFFSNFCSQKQTINLQKQQLFFCSSAVPASVHRNRRILFS